MTPTLFDLHNPAPDIPAGPAQGPPAEAKRLSNQCWEILAALRHGRQSNRALAEIALKYTGRISDLRRAGYVIECVERDHGTGLTWYELQRETT